VHPIESILTSIAMLHKREREHPTQKPLELLEYLVKTYTNEGDTVLDNTMGSGNNKLGLY
jgi:site-specific DNA-methyltransferase (adenine-specific)